MSEPILIYGALASTAADGWEVPPIPGLVDATVIAAAIRAVADPVLSLSVDSPGGEVTAAVAIVAALTDWAKAHPQGMIDITVQGLAASAAAVLLVLSPRMQTKVHAYRGSQIMFHGARVDSRDDCTASQLQDGADFLTGINDQIKRALLQTKTPPELVAQWLDGDREGWLSADDALAYGIISDIITADPVPVPTVTNSSKFHARLYYHPQLQKLTMDTVAKNTASPEAACDPTKKQPCASVPEKKPVCEDPKKPACEDPKPAIPPASVDPQGPAPAAPAPAPAPEKPDFKQLEDRITALEAKLAAAENRAAQSEATVSRLTAGLRASSSAPVACASDWKGALAQYRKDHPELTADDAFVACSRDHADLYRKTIVPIVR